MGIAARKVIQSMKIVVVNADVAADLHVAPDLNARSRREDRGRTSAVIADYQVPLGKTVNDRWVCQADKVGPEARLKGDIVAQPDGASARRSNHQRAVDA